LSTDVAKSQRREAERVLEASARIPNHVVHRSFPHETVVLNLETGRYHGLNASAGTMLTALERNETVRAAAEWLAHHYERPLEEIERDLAELCVELVERGLIELRSADGTGGP
jgi:hypothetical protein